MTTSKKSLPECRIEYCSSCGGEIVSAPFRQHGAIVFIAQSHDCVLSLKERVDALQERVETLEMYAKRRTP